MSPREERRRGLDGHLGVAMGHILCEEISMVAVLSCHGFKKNAETTCVIVW